MGVRETVLERTTGPYLTAVLKLMAFTFNRDEGLTAIVVTHDPTIAAQAKRAYHMLDGVIVKGVGE